MPTSNAAASEPDKPAHAEGKRRLIAAALKLAARGTGLSALGLRELAREAELNHNTFYRHFADLEDLGRAASAEIATLLMAGMKEVRLGAARHADATVGAVDYYLDCVIANPDVFIVGARELHTAASPMRAVLRETLAAIADESVEQITALKLAPIRDRAGLFRVALDITHYMLCRALDLLDAPSQRAAIRREMIGYVRRQFVGAIAIQQANRPGPGRKAAGANGSAPCRSERGSRSRAPPASPRPKVSGSSAICGALPCGGKKTERKGAKVEDEAKAQRTS